MFFVLLCLFFLFRSFAYNYSSLPSAGSCSGTEGAAIFGCALLTSYLFLVRWCSCCEVMVCVMLSSHTMIALFLQFIAFYRKTYKKGAKAPATKAAKTVQNKIE